MQGVHLNILAMNKTKKGINAALILVTTQRHKTFWTNLKITLFKNNDKKNVHECLPFMSFAC